MDTSHEFQYLPVPLMDLDIIPAITPEEVETYRNYLKTPNGTITQYAYYNGYQDHSSIKKSRDADGNGEMPNYYEYHYMVTGNTGLLLLPDLIGQEEERLIDVAWDCMEKWKLMEPVKNAKPVQKYLSYYSDEEQISLAQFLGDKHVVTFIRDMSTWTKEKPDMEVEWAMEYLSFCYPDPVPMLAAPTWQEGIQNTVLQHITQKVYERLPLIYEEYTLKKQLGIPIGYIEGESPRKRKPYPVMWIELARKVEKGIPVDRNEFLADKMW